MFAYTEMRWPKSIREAQLLQELHKRRIAVVPLNKEPDSVAGVDAAFFERSVFAAACLYRYPDLTLIERATAVRETDFPYIPGYLLFREGPACIAALKKLKEAPGLILVDGQGLAHPRGIGSASHLGVLLNTPTIGCAKTRLLGKFTNPGTRKGSWSELRHEEKTVGAVLRTRDGTRPLFLSPGHKIDLDDAIRFTLGCTGTYRIPEPLRCAHRAAEKMKSERG